MGWDTNWQIDVNPFDDLLDDGKDWFGDRVSQVRSALNFGNIFSTTTALNIAGTTPLGNLLLIGAGSKLGNEAMFKEGLEGLITLGTDEYLKFLLPERASKWVEDNLDKITSKAWVELNKDRDPFKIKRGGGNFFTSNVHKMGMTFVANEFARGHPLELREKYSRASERNSCIRCRRRGHVTVQCFAKTYKSGGRIE